MAELHKRNEISFFCDLFIYFVLDRNALYDSLVIQIGEKNQAGR